jgi:hypothetical protein
MIGGNVVEVVTGGFLAAVYTVGYRPVRVLRRIG